MQWERRISACDSGQQLCLTPCISMGWKWTCQTHGPIQNFHYSAWDKSKITIASPRIPNFIHDQMRHYKHRILGAQHCNQAQDLLRFNFAFLPAETAKNLCFSMSCLDTARLRSAGFVGPVRSLPNSPVGPKLPSSDSGPTAAKTMAALPGLRLLPVKTQ